MHEKQRPPLLRGWSLTCISPQLAATRPKRISRNDAPPAIRPKPNMIVAVFLRYLHWRVQRVAARNGDLHVRLQPSSRGGIVSRAYRIRVAGWTAFECGKRRSAPARPSIAPCAFILKSFHCACTPRPRPGRGRPLDRSP